MDKIRKEKIVYRGTLAERDSLDLSQYEINGKLVLNIEFIEGTGGNVYKYLGNGVWIQTATNGTPHVTAVDPANLSHIRFQDGITATIATGTKTVTFTQAEDVRAVRFFFSTANLFRVVFDASSDADAQAKLADPVASETTDAQHHLVDGSDGGEVGWTDWYEFSKLQTDLSLGRIDMVADSAAGPSTVYVEGR